MSAATTAIGCPGILRARQRGAAPSPSSDSSLSGPITARTPGVGPRSFEVERATRPCATGERSTAAWSIPASCTSTVKRTRPAARARRPAAARAGRRARGRRRPQSRLVALVDERPHVLIAALHLLLRLDEPGRHPLTRRSEDRALDLWIGAAAAEIADHGLAYLLARRLGRTLEQRRSADDLARRADTRTGARPRRRTPPARSAPPRGEPFDRHDLVTCRRLREQQTRVDRPPVEQHRARAACTLTASELRAEQLEVITQDVDEPPASGATR